jgi:UrcA family protein
MLKTLILSASLALAAAVPAAAADRDDSAQVRIDDLDLANPSDQQRLDRRVSAAARRICATGARNLAAITAENRCIALALESAAPQAERAIALARSNRRLAQIDLAVSG